MAANDEFPKGLQLTLLLVLMFLGDFLVAIDMIIVSVAVPEISTEFRALNDIGWYGSAYLLTLTALQPTYGVVYKHFDMKQVYIASIVLFEVGSTICATAPASEAFIIGRAIAGVGAAGLLQGAFAIITISSPLDKRPLYIGLVASGFGISSCFAPVIGGALTQKLTWRWCFWINLPIGAVTFFLVLTSLKIRSSVKCEPARQLSLKTKLLHLDPLGTVLFIGSMSCLFLAFQWAGTRYDWNSPTIIGLLVTFCVGLVLFVLSQWWFDSRAMVPLHVMSNRTVSCGALSLFFISLSNSIKLYFIPFYFQAVQATTIIESGIRFLSLAVPQVVASIAAGGIATATGFYIPIILIGETICSIGTGLLVMLGPSTSTALWASYIALSGFGDGLCCNIPYVAIQAILKSQSDIYTGNAIATFATLAGGGIAISVGQTILTNELASSVKKLVPSIPSQLVIQNGPLDLEQLTNNSQMLMALREAYGQAVAATMVFATVTICLSILPSSRLPWLNLKKVAKSRMGLEDSQENMSLDDYELSRARTQPLSINQSTIRTTISPDKRKD